MKGRDLVWLLILTLTSVVVAGCGGEPPGTPTQEAGNQLQSGMIDPCALLTREEAGAFLGEPVKEAEYNDTGNPLGQKICFYEAESEDSSRFIQISLIQDEGISAELRADGQSAAVNFSGARDLLSSKVHAVEGLGDEAFWGTPGLHVLQGNVYLCIGVGNTSDPANLALAQEIAQVILPRM